LSEIIRLIDGPLAPFGDADQLRALIDRDADHSALYRVFLEVRDVAAKILENTTLADLISREPARDSRPKNGERKTDTGNTICRKRSKSKKKIAEPNVLPMLAGGEGHD